MVDGPTRNSLRVAILWLNWLELNINAALDSGRRLFEFSVDPHVQKGSIGTVGVSSAERLSEPMVLATAICSIRTRVKISLRSGLVKYELCRASAPRADRWTDMPKYRG